MIAVLSAPEVRYPAATDHFSPSDAFPEYAHGAPAATPNTVYAAVRRLLADAGLDAARFGAADWNPFGGTVRPGSTVFVLCNFVYHRRPQESVEAFQAKCIHGSVLRAVIDYLLIAVGPAGRVRFGNSALQSCDWQRVLADTEADKVLEFYRARGLPVEAVDLRLYVAQRDGLGRVVSVDRRDETLAAADIDLSADSLLNELGRQGTPRYRISDYNPERIEMFHRDGSHHYVINRAILDSDVVLSLSKLKTHEKVGITCGLKGFVGTVAHKDCLAHHRFGSPAMGGDEYPGALGILPLVSRYHDWINRRPAGAPLQGLLQFLERAVRRVLRRAGVVMAGAWSGNDTAWRMSLDLARIVHYADRHGVLHDAVQRPNLSLIDGVVGGEGEGPLAPEPVAGGTLVFGESVVDTDRIAARIMGFDPDAIPLLRGTPAGWRYPLPAGAEPFPVAVNGKRAESTAIAPPRGRRFRPSSGWRERLGGRG